MAAIAKAVVGIEDDGFDDNNNDNNNEGYEEVEPNALTFVQETEQETHDTQCLLRIAMARQRDSEWDDENGEGESSADDPVPEPQIVATRVLRSSASAAASAIHPAPSQERQTPDAMFLAFPKIPEKFAVDEEHLSLLLSYNQSVDNLRKLKHYLESHMSDSRSLLLHLCEEAVLLDKEAELNYLATCEVYQAALGPSNNAYVCEPISVDVQRAHRSKIVKGKTVVQGKDENGKWPMSEIVGEWIVLAHKGEKDQFFPEDADYAVQGDLPPTDENTLKAFLRDLNDTCAVNNIPHTGVIAFLDCLRRHAPDVRTGVRPSKRGEGMVHDFNKYLIKDWRDVSIDACPNHCILYVGKYRWAIRCPCGEYRYSKCTNNGKCKEGGINCDPFKTPSHNQRSSYLLVKYR